MIGIIRGALGGAPAQGRIPVRGGRVLPASSSRRGANSLSQCVMASVSPRSAVSRGSSRQSGRSDHTPRVCGGWLEHTCTLLVRSARDGNGRDLDPPRTLRSPGHEPYRRNELRGPCANYPTRLHAVRRDLRSVALRRADGRQTPQGLRVGDEARICETRLSSLRTPLTMRHLACRPRFVPRVPRSAEPA